MWEYDQNELYHYGIKGMRWGVRRTDAQLGHIPKKSSGKSKNVSSNPKKVIAKSKKISSKQQRKNEMKNMSDAELRSRINRIQMEKQYMQLTEPQLSPGKKFVKDVLTNAAKQTVTNYTAKYMTKGMEALMDQAKKK